VRLRGAAVVFQILHEDLGEDLTGGNLDVPGAANAQLGPARLWPMDVKEPGDESQSSKPAAVLPPIIEFCTTAVPFRAASPPLVVAVLRETVPLRNSSEPRLRMPPTAPGMPVVLLPEIVLRTTVAFAKARLEMPPSDPSASLLEMVVPVTVSLPSLKMPPPFSVASFPSTVLLMSVTVAPILA
jgi:hypothetical protein